MRTEPPLVYNKKTARTWRQRLEALQDGTCCVCRRTPPFEHRVFDRIWSAIFADGELLPEETLSILWVDHDHDSGAVRGMLCSDCNAAIMPLEFGRQMDDAREQYLAIGGRLQYAHEHMRHRVVKTTSHSLRLDGIVGAESLPRADP